MENLQVTIIETGKLQGIHGWDPNCRIQAFLRSASPAPGAALIYTASPPRLGRRENGGSVRSYRLRQPVPGSNPREFWTREIQSHRP